MGSPKYDTALWRTLEGSPKYDTALWMENVGGFSEV